MKTMNFFMVFVLLFFISAIANPVLSDSIDSIISLSLVNQDPDPAIPGDIVEVRLGVENLGSSSEENLILEFVPSYPFTIVPGESGLQKVGTIGAYQEDANMKIVKFNVMVNRDATAGDYNLKIKRYKEGSSSSVEKRVSISVESKKSAEVIHIDKSTIIPGYEDTLKFTINNVGRSPLKDITFYWENKDDIILPVGSDNTRYINYIDVGESKELEYNVIADTNADPGLYKINLYISYDNPITSEEELISTIAGIYIGGDTNFDVAFSESSSGETSFSIANIGSNPALSVSVIVPQQTGWKVSGSNSVIIGNLNKGDYTVASFTLQESSIASSKEGVKERMTQRSNEPRDGVKSNKSSDGVKIQVAYTNTKGERKIVEKNVQINQQSFTSITSETGETIINAMPNGNMRSKQIQQQGFLSKYKGYMIVLVIVLAGLLVYKVYKKRKLKEPNLKLIDMLKNKNK